MIVDESPVTNDTTIDTEEENNSVSTSGDMEEEDNFVSTSGDTEEENNSVSTSGDTEEEDNSVSTEEEYNNATSGYSEEEDDSEDTSSKLAWTVPPLALYITSYIITELADSYNCIIDESPPAFNEEQETAIDTGKEDKSLSTNGKKLVFKFHKN